VLLDLNLPRMDGYEVLAAIRADQALTHLPVVVLTTSTADEDVMASYRLHASAFMSKPSDYHTYVGALRSLDHFYNDVATLPSRTT
jgi:two-component system response regulator